MEWNALIPRHACMPCSRAMDSTQAVLPGFSSLHPYLPAALNRHCTGLRYSTVVPRRQP